MKKIIEIDGMNCSNCIGKVENLLYCLPQVEDVKVNLEAKNAEVIFNSEVDDELLKNLIDTGGHYTVKNIQKV